MNRETKYWLRWIAVVPGALLAAIIVSLIIRTVLYYTLFALISAKPRLIEIMLQPFLIGVGFIYFGSLIAPERNNKTLIILFVLCISVYSVFGFLTLYHSERMGYWLQIRDFVPILVSAILGACIGVSLVYGKMMRLMPH